MFITASQSKLGIDALLMRWFHDHFVSRQLDRHRRQHNPEPGRVGRVGRVGHTLACVHSGGMCTWPCFDFLAVAELECCPFLDAE